MKVSTVVVALVLAGALLTGVVWLGQSGNSALPVIGGETPATKPADDPSEPLPIAATGPYPKVVVDEEEHDFGIMAVDEERRYKFVVRNEGEAPLKLKKGESTCKCTLSELAQQEIPPGGSAEIELAWTPKSSDAEFRQTAFVWTNDPEQKQIKLSVHGRVVQLVELRPGIWELGTISEGIPSSVSGTIHSSAVEDLELTSIETSSPLITATHTKLSESDLQELDPDAKAGYRLEVTVVPEMPIGSIKETVTLHVEADGSKTFPIEVRGTRSGPLRFLKMPGYEWYPESLAMSFGRFRASEGRKGNVLLIVHAMEGKAFEFTDVQVDPEFLKVSLQPNVPGDTGERQAYTVSIEVPAGSPPMSRVRKQSGKIRVQTNHPEAPEIRMHAEFISY